MYTWWIMYDTELHVHVYMVECEFKIKLNIDLITVHK